jgi:putative transposase
VYYDNDRAGCIKPVDEPFYPVVNTSAAIIDSQSVKTTEQGGPHGYDGGKKVNGRKRHVLVDTLGLLLKVVVHPANIQDREGAKLVLTGLDRAFPRLHHL